MLYSLWSAVIGVTKWGCPKGLKDGLRHTNISLSKSVNMLLLLMLVAMENQIMKCLLRSGTNQPMERINIYHWGSLCICQDLGEIQQCLSFSRNCIKRDGACISELWYFPTPYIPLPEFLTGSAVSIQPQRGIIDTDPTHHIPPSISVEPSIVVFKVSDSDMILGCDSGCDSEGWIVRKQWIAEATPEVLQWSWITILRYQLKISI